MTLKCHVTNANSPWLLPHIFRLPSSFFKLYQLLNFFVLLLILFLDFEYSIIFRGDSWASKILIHASENHHARGRPDVSPSWPFLRVANTEWKFRTARKLGQISTENVVGLDVTKLGKITPRTCRYTNATKPDTFIDGEPYASQHTILYNRGSLREKLKRGGGGGCFGRLRERRIRLVCVQLLLLPFLYALWSKPANFMSIILQQFFLKYLTIPRSLIIWKKIIAVIHITFAVAKKKKKAWKNSGLYGIRILDQCDTSAGGEPGRWIGSY